MNTIICFSFVLVFGLFLFSVRYECYFWGFYVLQFMYVYEYECLCVCMCTCMCVSLTFTCIYKISAFLKIPQKITFIVKNSI